MSAFSPVSSSANLQLVKCLFASVEGSLSLAKNGPKEISRDLVLENIKKLHDLFQKATEQKREGIFPETYRSSVCVHFTSFTNCIPDDALSQYCREDIDLFVKKIVKGYRLMTDFRPQEILFPGVFKGFLFKITKKGTCRGHVFGVPPLSIVPAIRKTMSISQKAQEALLKSTIIGTERKLLSIRDRDAVEETFQTIAAHQGIVNFRISSTPSQPYFSAMMTPDTGLSEEDVGIMLETVEAYRCGNINEITALSPKVDLQQITSIADKIHALFESLEKASPSNTPLAFFAIETPHLISSHSDATVIDLLRKKEWEVEYVPQ